MVGVLIEASASLTLEEYQSQTPIDMLPGPMQEVVSKENNLGRLLVTLLTSRWWIGTFWHVEKCCFIIWN